MDLRKATTEELTQMIIDAGGGIIGEEQLKGQGKWDLVKIYKAMIQDTQDTPEDNKDGAQVTNFIPVIEPVKLPPSYCSTEWSDYVMSKFTDDELVTDKNGKKNPTLAGLRRVAPLLLGNIVSSEPVSIQCSLETDKPNRAVVTYRVVFDWFNEGKPVVFGSLAGAWIGSVDTEYAVYMEAVCESRAEGRTLRKALNIRNVCAEELTSQNNTEIVDRFKEKIMRNDEDGGLITDVQQKMLDVLSSRLGINLNKLLLSEQCPDLSKMQYSKAVTLIKKLNTWQGANSTEVPKELLEEK